MNDLAQQIRDRLERPAIICDFSETTWTPEQIEEFRRRFLEAQGGPIRILPVDAKIEPSSDQMRTALLAVLEMTEPGEPLPPDAQDGRDYCEREIDDEVEARDALIVEIIAEALGIEVDGG